VKILFKARKRISALIEAVKKQILLIILFNSPNYPFFYVNFKNLKIES
jgi:hypothetical protein